jgi:hypothetical protein
VTGWQFDRELRIVTAHQHLSNLRQTRAAVGAGLKFFTDSRNRKAAALDFAFDAEAPDAEAGADGWTGLFKWL